MSILATVLVLIASAIVYVGVIFLSRSYNLGGRDTVNPLYTISQWNPNGLKITSTCVVPGRCIIEGLTGAYQNATRWCNVDVCIDPNTGENVKGTDIPARVECEDVPYCGWSECILTFDQDLYVKVTFNSNGVGKDPTITLSNVPSTGNPSLFYMERIAVGTNGLEVNQNGILTSFRFIQPGDTKIYMLTYTNNYLPPNSSSPITALGLRPESNVGSALLTTFVLMESMPVTISPHSFPSLAGPVKLVSKKILVFGGVNRSQDPNITEILDFNSHSQGSMWNNANKYFLVAIFFDAGMSIPGFYGKAEDNYVKLLNNWNVNLPKIDTVQDAIESRLATEPGGNLNRKFYNWIGTS